MSRPIHYEPHPVSPERKAELRAQGVQIIDAKYAPKTEATMSKFTVVANKFSVEAEGKADQKPRKARKAVNQTDEE